MSKDEWFEDRPKPFRKIYDALARHMKKLGKVTIDFVTVGIFFKRVRTFAEIRPKRDRLVLWFLVSRPIAHPKIAKSVKTSAHRLACCVDLASPADVDDDVRAWLAEAYLSSPD